MADFTIVPLSEKPEFADICAAWSFGEWGCHIPGLTIEQTQKNYRERATYLDRLPFVAIGETNGKAAGMISLKESDHPDRQDITDGLWVNSLFVHRRFQRTGLAQHLYEFLEKVAKERFKAKKLYTFTCRATTAYESMGYKKIGMVRDTTGFHPQGEPLLMKTL